LKPALYQNKNPWRPGCTQFLGGHGSLSLAEEFSQLSEYCRLHNIKRDLYGVGEFVQGYENEVADLLGTEAAIFMPSGAMAQQIACRLWCLEKKKETIAMHSTCQMEINEHHAYQYLHGLNALLIGDPLEFIRREDIVALEGSDIAVVVIELPMRQIGGVLPSFEELVELCQEIRKRGIALHMDGARLYECAPFFKRPYSDLADLFDSIYLSTYKGLNGWAGAFLAGRKSFIDDARPWLRRHGGNLKEITPYLLSSYLNFKTNLEKVEAWHEQAKSFAQLLNRFSLIQTRPKVPQTHMMHIDFKATLESLEKARDHVAEKYKLWTFSFFIETPMSDKYMTEVALYDSFSKIDLNTLEQALEEFHELLEQK
jgi:threonine aldolase